MNTEELKKLAEAATPGLWVIDAELTGKVAPHLMTDEGHAIADFWGDEGSLGLKRNERNAAYIAAANPSTILALIAERDELLAALKDARRELAYAGRQEAHDAASAAIAKVEG